MTSPRSDLLNQLLRLWRHTAPRRHRQFFFLLGLMLLSAVAEVLSLGAVFPFLAVLVSPERVFEQPVVARVAQTFGWASGADLVLPLTILFSVAVLVAGAIRLLVLWVTNRFCFAVGIDLSINTYQRTLYQPYPVHVARNSSEVISGITGKISTVVLSVLMPGLLFVSSLVVLLSMVALLLAIDPRVAIWSAVGFGGSYAVVTLLSRRRLDQNSGRIAAAQSALQKTLQEGLGGIRDVLLDGTQSVYVEAYHRADRSLRMAQGSNTFISVSPRPAMEALGMGLMAMIAYAAVTQPGGISTALPVLGALALGAQRLIPAFQQTYASWSTIAGSRASLSDTLDLLDQPLPPEASEPPPPPLPFRESIRFEDVRFRYSPDGPWVLDQLDFTIPKGARVGIVGATGSGKSTVVDLLMGLLEPTSGHLVIDRQPLARSGKRAWQRNIAHVPQTVYLADASLAENIAFGVPKKDIDMTRVRKVAAQAQISDFIESSADGYDAMVGERGVRLSGGQRQRIGIARALYKNATVLVFDEATSALDTVTELAVMDAISALERDLTILIVAHRLTTIRACDPIVELRHGRVAGLGSFDELLRQSKTFGAMAGQGHP